MVTNKMKKFLSALFVTAGLSACSMAPGIHIEADTSNDSWFKVNEDKAIEFEIKRINHRVLEQLASSKTDNQDISELLDSSDYAYRVGKGDVLLITVFEHPELNIQSGPTTHPEASGTLVKNDGTIFFPYAGNVQAAGNTVEAIRQELSRKITSYIKKPQLDVRVVKYASQRVVVSGEVKQPSVLPITTVPMSIVDAIQLAGGLTPFANEREVVLTRNNKVHTINLTELYKSGLDSSQLRMQSGDTLYVKDLAREKVFVMGEVLRPKPVQIQKHGLSLTEALGEVGGIDNKFANAKGVFVIRENSDSEVQTIYQLDASQPYAMVLADKFELQAKDVVFVTASDVTRWNRVITQILPTASLLKTSSDVND